MAAAEMAARADTEAVSKLMEKMALLPAGAAVALYPSKAAPTAAAAVADAVAVVVSADDAVEVDETPSSSRRLLPDDRAFLGPYLLPEYDFHYASLLARLATPALQEELRRQDYAILDGAFGAAAAHAYRQEMLWLFEQGFFKSNVTAFVKNDPLGGGGGMGTAAANTSAPMAADTNFRIQRLFSKAHIFELELLADVRHRVPRLSHLFSSGIPALEAILRQQFPELKLYSGDTSIKLQVNEGGGAFNFHYDSPGGKRDSRRLTLLLYLNPAYVHGRDGGELRLQPFLRSGVDVPPVFDRVVLFRSDKVLHRVLKSNTQRVCFTIWFHGRSDEEEEEKMMKDAAAPVAAATDASVDPEERYAAHWLSLISKVTWQRILSKYLYLEPWTQSIIDAHGSDDSHGGASLLESLRADVSFLSSQTENGLSKVLEFLKGKASELGITNIDQEKIEARKRIEEKKLLREKEKKDEEQMEPVKLIVEDGKETNAEEFSALDLF